MRRPARTSGNLCPRAFAESLSGMTLRSRIVLFALLAAASSARADAVFQTSLTIALPQVLPRLVVVQPGVQVVEDLDEEVFFVDSWYWVRRGTFWYRARNPHATWVYADARFIPPGLRRIPAGQYRHYRHADWKEMQREEKERRHAEREEAKERHHAEREEAKEHHHAEKQGRKDWKDEHKGGKHHDHDD